MYSCSYLLSYFWVWDIFLGIIIKKTKTNAHREKSEITTNVGKTQAATMISASVLIEPFQSDFSVIL